MVSKIPRVTFESYGIDIRLPANFALVGTDFDSQEWLKTMFPKIVDSSAVVIVIDAPTIDAYNHVENVLRRAGVRVVHSSSDPFIDVVKGYPALVANGRVYP